MSSSKEALLQGLCVQQHLLRQIRKGIYRFKKYDIQLYEQKKEWEQKQAM